MKIQQRIDLLAKLVRTGHSIDDNIVIDGDEKTASCFCFYFKQEQHSIYYDCEDCSLWSSTDRHCDQPETEYLLDKVASALIEFGLEVELT